MRVEISHNVDWVPGEHYNFLDYEFFTGSGRIRARAYSDTMRQVSVRGRFKSDGSPAVDPRGLLETSIDEATALDFFAKMDPRGDEEFPAVLSYLRERFEEVQMVGPQGLTTIATGLTEDEIKGKADEIRTVHVSARIDLGDDQ